MADLISIDRALAQIPTATDDDTTVIAALITAASQVVETKLNRTFAQASYDELHSVVGPTASIWANNPPISDLTGVRNNELPAFYVQLNDPANLVQRATVDITPTAVVLKKTLNNVSTTSTFTFAAYPTFEMLYAAVNALGSGWTATGMNSQFLQWQTAEMCTNHGTRSARNVSCPLLVFWWDEVYYQVNKTTGEIILPAVRGVQNYRIQYTGGFSTVPEAVQQAVAELVQLTFASRLQNPLMQSETLDKYSYTKAAQNNWDLLSLTSKSALSMYKIPRLTTQGVPSKI
ncbi:hypothetical protein GobsT_18520 [Gemmata obscuriglobus]|uniref:Uncharacterized protein n=1 Tax=Gemmata obscuriglobus TaxID=114 RepID=A0A2Z3H881_9BACT